MARLLGIFGGTFDPVHFGHLRTAAELIQKLGLEQVRFIPNRVPPHRQQPWLDVETRQQLLQLALAGYQDFVLDDRELRRDGPSYMVDTLADLHGEFPEHALCLIIGMDAFAGFTRWHRWQAILELGHLVVMNRPGAELPSFAEHQSAIESRICHDETALQRSLHGQILLQSVSPVDISATMIRDRLQHGQTIADLVPEPVKELLETRYAI